MTIQNEMCDFKLKYGVSLRQLSSPGGGSRFKKEPVVSR